MSDEVDPGGFDEACPLCGGDIYYGFGLMGGGYGAYEFCLNDDCGFFDKEEDPMESE